MRLDLTPATRAAETALTEARETTAFELSAHHAAEVALEAATPILLRSLADQLEEEARAVPLTKTLVAHRARAETLKRVAHDLRDLADEAAL